jgi:hypothetical protein
MSVRRVQLACGIIAFVAWCQHAQAKHSVAPTEVIASSDISDLSDFTDPRLFPGSEQEALPPNLELPSGFEDWIRSLWLRSPTFRRQCHRLARSPNWHVHVSVRPQLSGIRAHTEFSLERNSNRVNASMELGFQNGPMVELLGHELEHVMEQIDGIDLAQLAQRGTNGVSHGPSKHYETERANATGKRIAWEFNHADHTQAQAPVQ